jgi:hypothetical protein
MSPNASTSRSRRLWLIATAAVIMSTAGAHVAVADVTPPPPPVPPPADVTGTPPPAPPGQTQPAPAPPSASGGTSTTTPPIPPGAPPVPPSMSSPPPAGTPSSTNGQPHTDAVSARLGGRVVTVRIRCAESGRVAVSTVPGRKLGTAPFTCAAGRAAARIRVSSRAARQLHRGVRLRIIVRSPQAAPRTTTLQIGSARTQAVAADATTNTYCEYDAASGLPYCYDYWFNTWGPAKWQGYWIFGGQARASTGGEYLGTLQYWFYWSGSQWIRYDRHWL